MRRKQWNRNTQATATIALGILFGGCVPESQPNSSPAEQPVIWGTDNRTPLSESFFTANASARAIGRLDTSVASCTATHIGGNMVMTARQCFNDAQVPSNIIFRPGHIDNGVPHPSIRGKRIIRGTGDDGKINVGGTYVPGNDWALIEVDPSTYSQGSAGYPSSFANWPAIPLGNLPNPIETPVTVSLFGYSGALYAHYNCSVRQDGVCNPAYSFEGNGIELSNCEAENGAAGGPLISGWGTSTPRIVAVTAGHGFRDACYSDSIANKVISVNSARTAPKFAAGLTFTYAGNQAPLAIASDSSVLGGVAWNNFDSTDYFHPLHQWVPWGDNNIASRSLGRMTSALTPDSHAFIFANTQSGIVSRWETSPGAWSAWAQWFPGSSMNFNVVDLEAVSANPVALQVFTVHTDGRIRTRRKVGAFDAAWGNEVDLGVLPGARAIAAGVVGGYQSLFAITSSAVSTQWETSPGSNQWVPWIDFTAGLPAGLELRDVTVDYNYRGYIDLYVLGKQTDGVVKVFRRTKLGFVGAGWTGWSPFLTVPAGTTQLEAGPGGGIEDDPRLLLLNNGEILIHRPGHFDGSSVDDKVVPAYSPERTTSCPAAPPPLPC